MPISAILAALLTVATANGASSANRPVLRVVVETDSAIGTDRRMLTDIVAGAREIWRPYADVTFDFATEQTGSATALRLLFTDRVSALSEGASLGWIAFVDGQPSNLITVSTTAAAALMQRSQWNGLPPAIRRIFLVRALSRAVAHEIGHYLLASHDHTAHGLMRGNLTADDVMQPQRSAYQLDRAQVQRLQRSTLLARRDDADGAAASRP